jgi:hypothetical protein
MSSTDNLFKMIQDLIASRPFSVDGVDKITGHQLHQKEKTWNRLFLEFTSENTADPLVRATELRTPKRDMPRANENVGILSLDIQPTLCVELKDVKSRFGDSPQLVVPSAHAPLSVPTGYEYRLPWGTLNFGFSREGRACLVRVVLSTE